ncbi:lytic murein transglycosylase B [Pontibacter sp. JAM-7]|uniref:lytic murein transglycosylase B n=1 Tax=Pontibacter sp. JAM-7 TaxID=3366581 RepID=UPI003AF94872
MSKRNKDFLLSVMSLVLLLTGCSATATAPDRQQNYADHPEAQSWIESMKAEGFTEAYLRQVLSQAKRQDSIIKAMSRPAEKRLNWEQYSNIFVKPKRVDQGVAFWHENQAALARAAATYGVPEEIIVAIIGVETRYGRITGSYRVLDALATLGFDYPKRGSFFQGQLTEYLRMVQEEQIDFAALKGSYAGAMGYGQFIPSSFRAYAVDFDGDGKRDIWNNRVDAIGSVANYFAEHKWRSSEPVLAPVVFNQPAQDEWFNQSLKPSLTLSQWREKGASAPLKFDENSPATLMKMELNTSEEYWFGLHNFYVITRYNHSRLYAMAVYRLSEQIKAAYQASQAG